MGLIPKSDDDDNDDEHDRRRRVCYIYLLECYLSPGISVRDHTGLLLAIEETPSI